MQRRGRWRRLRERRRRWCREAAVTSAEALWAKRFKGAQPGNAGVALRLVVNVSTLLR